MRTPEYETYAKALWYLAWPDVDWSEASDNDKKMYRDHAQSLTTYYGG